MKAKKCVAVLFLISLSGLFLGGCSSNMNSSKMALSVAKAGQDTRSETCSCMRGGTPRNWLFGIPVAD